MDGLANYANGQTHANVMHTPLFRFFLLHDDRRSTEDGFISASFIGIIIAISGNILISLALNCQKLAHQRLERKREEQRKVHRATSSGRRINGERVEEVLPDSEGDEEDYFNHRRNDLESRLPRSHSYPDEDIDSDEEDSVQTIDTPTRPNRNVNVTDRAQAFLLESEPLLVVASPATSIRNGYYSSGLVGRDKTMSRRSSRGLSRKRGLDYLKQLFIPKKTSANEDLSERRPIAVHTPYPPVDVQVNGRTNGRPTTLKFADAPRKEENSGNESDYLKSKLWWLGFVLMNVGEMGNFISYGFAPASVVAPLGTFALIANCFFAPLMLKEKFRKRDLLGIALAILGAVTVVLSTNPSDTRLDPDGLVHAITQRPFIILAIIYIIGATVLVGLSSQEIGHTYVFVDVGACALFGGFTVLSTKAFSSLLTLEWGNAFREWITYPIIVILVATGVGQIRYLNRALMKFDSKVVIPTQFVLFNLSAIVGSAILYGDFRKATLHQMTTFLYGCGATFAGVFFLTWGSAVSTSEVHDNVRDRAEQSGRGQLILPSSTGSLRGQGRVMPIVRARASSLNLVGLSPAQRVLLVRTATEGAGREEDVTSIL